MISKQKTIKKEVVLEGRGLHTGNQICLRLKPAEVGSGISFIRTDLENKPVIKTCFDNIISDTEIPRCTSLGKDDIIIHTVEHLMSALSGLEIDNLIVELNGNELPGLDGSGYEYFRALEKAGMQEQEAERQFIEIHEPISVAQNGSSLLIVPDKEFKISYALSYDHPVLRSQYVYVKVDRDSFSREIAQCRTFCLEEEARALQESGLGKGANYDNTLVVGEKGIIGNELRMPDELARHKILDFIGDMYLLGQPLRGHVFAMRSGHQLNMELMKSIIRQQKMYQSSSFVPKHDWGDQSEFTINEIMKILPHRYPFLLVDRIVSIEKDRKAVGIKNITINEEFFSGHFPSRPVMPGVLIVEAMAQVGGVLVMTSDAHKGKVALFMATDNVKFRKLVEPGDQLVLDVEMIRDRSKTAYMHGQAKVNGQVTTEADIAFSFVDASFLG